MLRLSVPFRPDVQALVTGYARFSLNRAFIVLYFPSGFIIWDTRIFYEVFHGSVSFLRSWLVTYNF